MRRALWTIVFLVMWPAALMAVERFPAPSFRSGYQLLPTDTTAARSWIWTYVDVAVLAGALGVGAWVVFTKRSRQGVFLLTIFSLAYFGFYRKGCVCPIGAIQNVAMAAGHNGYALPWGVALFFVLPLLVTLFYGRVFCAGVCPLGAMQDLVLWKPIRMPVWLEHALGLIAYVYLGLAVLLAATGTDSIICRYDPFVSFFRVSGAGHLLFLGAAFLLASMFIGRVYCRFICPYSVLLRLLSPFSRKRVTITPDQCVDCRLCETSCPFGAIRNPTPREPPRQLQTGRKQLIAVLAGLPVVIGLFTFLGYANRTAMARMDFTVRLAERIWQEETHAVSDSTDESTAFRRTGQPIAELYQQANAIQDRFKIGAPLFGAWVGLAIGAKLITLILRRRRVGYTADASACVACSRCYASCPVEQERRKPGSSILSQPGGLEAAMQGRKLPVVNSQASA